MTPSPALITTKAQLLAYIEQHALDHVKAGGHACSCGWAVNPDDPVDVEVTWELHADGTLIGGLGDVLPSDTRNAGEQPLTWMALTDDLYRTIEYKNSILEQIARIARQ